MIEFDQEEILMALVGLIRVKGEEDQKKEQFLLSKTGDLVEIKTGKKEEIKFDRKIPYCCATFQINRKFYVCGG